MAPNCNSEQKNYQQVNEITENNHPNTGKIATEQLSASFDGNNRTEASNAKHDQFVEQTTDGIQQGMDYVGKQLDDFTKKNHIQEKVNSLMKSTGEKLEVFDDNHGHVVQNTAKSIETSAVSVRDRIKEFDNENNISNNVADGVESTGNKLKEWNEKRGAVVEGVSEEVKAQAENAIDEVKEKMMEDEQGQEQSKINKSESVTLDRNETITKSSKDSTSTNRAASESGNGQDFDEVMQQTVDSMKTGAARVGDHLQAIDNKHHISEKVAEGVSSAGQKLEEFDNHTGHVIQNTANGIQKGAESVIDRIKEFDNEHNVSEKVAGGFESAGNKVKEFDGNHGQVVQKAMNGVKSGADWAVDRLEINDENVIDFASSSPNKRDGDGDPTKSTTNRNSNAFETN